MRTWHSLSPSSNCGVVRFFEMVKGSCETSQRGEARVTTTCSSVLPSLKSGMKMASGGRINTNSSVSICPRVEDGYWGLERKVLSLFLPPNLQIQPFSGAMA